MSQFPSRAIDDFLARVKASGRSLPPVAVFDCDGTIIKGDIGEAMFYRQAERFLLRVNPANIWLNHPRRDELDTLYNALVALPVEKRMADRRFVSLAEMMVGWYFDQLAAGHTEQACSDIVKLWARFTESEIALIAQETYVQELSAEFSTRKIGKYFVPQGIRYIEEAVALLRLLQQHNFDIWAISGSNVWSVRAVFEPLGIPRDHIIGIGLNVGGGIFLPKVIPPVPVLEGKVAALRERTEVIPSIVVSDSAYDLPLFNVSSELKVLVNSRMENSYTFFKDAAIQRDASWVVIEKPTLIGTSGDAHPFTDTATTREALIDG